MKISVTGATGHIGTNLIPRLLDKNHEIRILFHNNGQHSEFKNVEIIHGDILDTSCIDKFTFGQEVVIHMAAKISIEKKSPEAYAINTRGTENILNACKKNGVRRFIHFSSIHSLKSFPLNKVLDENRELNLDSIFDYDRSKAMGEKMVMEASGGELEIIVLNPTAVIGPFDHWPSLLGKAIINLYKGRIPALVEGGYDWVDVRDISEATLNAISIGRPGEKYMLSGHWKSLKELAGSIHKAGGKKPPSFKVPFSVAMAGAGLLNIFLQGKERLFTTVSLESLKNGHRNISHEKAERDLKFNPRTFDDTIADTLEWFRNNNYLI